MATTIDQKVVELRFDNRDFERNTKETMSTLDKLKLKMNFKGASDGLMEVSDAARRVNFNGLADGIQQVSLKFSALEVVGVTALVNITNAAMNAGKQLINSLTINNVTSGWDKMAKKMQSVQTLVNSTGLEVEEIEEYLEQLMWYSDETSYSFNDMTSALASMTSTGGNIKKLIPMIRGVANATAFAGKGSAEFSRVMFNLNQSYNAGYLQYRDWQSVMQAGANSKQLTEQLIAAGEALGKIKKGSVTVGTFTETLKNKWVTTEVMETAFAKFDELSALAYESVKRGYVLLKDGTKIYVNTASEAIEVLGDHVDELALKGFRAAQEAKTYSEAIESVKDAASSAWSKIFETIFGNYDKQRAIFTNLANWLWDVFVQPIENMKDVIDDAFNLSSIKTIFDKIANNPLSKAIDDINNKVKKGTHTLEEYQKIVKDVWRGKYKNAPQRHQLLEDAGYNWHVVQNLVNKGVKYKDGKAAGYNGYKVTQEDVIAAEKKHGIYIEETAKAEEKLIEVEEEDIRIRLKKMGLSEDEIEYYLRLEESAKRYHKTLDDFIKEMSGKDLRDMIFGKKDATGEKYETVGIAQDIAATLTNIFTKIGEAWSETFGHITSIDIYQIINNIKKFTEQLNKMTSDKNSQGMKNLKDTFKGLFSILKLVTTVMGAGFKIAWTIFKTVLRTLGYDILDVTGAIGSIISAFTDFITKNEFVLESIKFIAQFIADIIVSIHDWIVEQVTINKLVEKFGNIIGTVKEWLKTFVSDGKKGLGEFLKDLKKFFDGLKNTDNIPKYIFDSFIKGCQKYGTKAWNGIKTVFDNIINKLSSFLGVTKGENEGFFSFGVNIVKGLINGIKSESGSIISKIAEWASGIISTFAEKLGIHSPSQVFFDFGKNIVEGLFNGISTIVGMVYTLITTIGEKLIDTVKNMDLGSIFAGLVSAGAVFGLIQIAKAFNIFAEGLQNVNEVLKQAAGVLKAFKGVLNAAKIKIYTSAIKDIAIALAILVGSIVVLSLLDTGKVLISLGAIAILVGLLAGLVVVAGKFGKEDALDFAKFALTILAVGVAIALMARAFAKIASIEKISWEAIGVFALLLLSLVGIAFIAGRAKKQLIAMGGTLLAIGVALLLMSRVVKYLGGMKREELIQGTIALGIFEGMIVGLFAAAKLLTGSTNIAKIGGALLAVSACFILMAIAVKKLGKMKKEELIQGTIALGVFEGMIVGLIAATKLLTGSKNIDKIGGAILSVGATILLMALTAKLLGSADVGKLIKGTIFVGIFEAMIIGLIYAIKKIGGRDIENLNKTLFGVAACIGIMTLSVVLLGLMSIGNLAKGIIAVGMLTLFVIGLIKSTEKARNLGKSLWALVAGIAILVLAVGLLSLIDPKRLLAPTLALSLLMICFGLLIRMSKDIGGAKGDIAKLAIMVGLIAILSGIVAGLSLLDPKSVLTSTAALSLLLIALLGGLFIMSKIQLDMKSLATTFVGLLLIVGVLLTLIGGIMLLGEVQNVESIVMSLVIFMGALTVMLIGIAATGAIYAATGGIGMLGLVALAAMIPFIFAIIGALALMNSIENADKNAILLTYLMSSIMAVLIPLALIGPLLAVAVVALYGLVTLMGVMLIFVTAIGALVTYVPMLTEFMATGMKIMIALAGGLGEMIGAFIGGALVKLSEGLPQIGINLSMFMMNAMPFITGCKLITNQHLKAVGILTAAILLLTAADFVNGIVKFLKGGSNFSDLGTELSKFMIKATPFITGVAMIPASMMNGVKALSQAILMLTAANVLNGLADFFGGGSASLTDFANQLPNLGTKLGQFVTNLGTFTDAQVNAADCAGKAIVALAEASEKIPKKDGLWQAIFGETDLAGFAEAMPDVAKGVKEFVNELGTFGDSQIRTAECACKVITAIADAADKVPKQDGLWQKIFGSNGLKDFAKDMPTVAEGVAGFIDKLKGYEKQANVGQAAGDIISGLSSLSKIDYNKFKAEDAKKALVSVGEGVKSFVDSLKDMTEDDVSSAANKMDLIVSAVQKMISTIDTSFNDNTSTLVSTAETVAKKAAGGLYTKNVLTELTKQGKNFVKGFADGITNNKQLATDAASQMGKDALQSSKDSLKEKSPSKLTMEQGEYFGEGFVIGIEKYSTKIYDVSSNVGTEAKKGLTESISKISNLVESGIDANPTITPVLDLSEVSNGAGLINSMFNNPSMQLAANLNSISSSMNQRNQNGNSDVISAIDKLSKNLGSSSGNTYNINGITYDDSNSINKAVQDLVRAIEIERRV